MSDELPTKTIGFRISGLLCAAVLCGTLIAGLWPFRRPPNGVIWLENENGLRLKAYATVWSAASFPELPAPDGNSCSLELWLQPAVANEADTILAFSTAPEPRRLTIRQYRSLLILTREIRGTSHPAIIGSDAVFRGTMRVFVTVVLGSRDSAMYVDGTLARKFPGFQSDGDCAGQLVIGSSPVTNDSWSGQVRGVAIYRQELSPVQVLSHYQTWTAEGRPDLSAGEQPVALYLLDERGGSVVHNAVPGGIDLSIPSRYSLVHQRFLQPFWQEFKPDRGYVKDILINIFGLVPLGFFFCAYWTRMRPIPRALLVTTALGLAVSLTIEILQSYLPTRDSGTTDLITNTLGTFLGAKLYDWEFARDVYEMLCGD
jgi:VanZ family protein